MKLMIFSIWIFKKYVYKNRGKINKLFKGLSPEKKKEYLERLYVKLSNHQLMNGTIKILKVRVVNYITN